MTELICTSAENRATANLANPNTVFFEAFESLEFDPTHNLVYQFTTDTPQGDECGSKSQSLQHTA